MNPTNQCSYKCIENSCHFQYLISYIDTHVSSVGLIAPFYYTSAEPLKTGSTNLICKSQQVGQEVYKITTCHHFCTSIYLWHWQLTVTSHKILNFKLNFMRTKFLITSQTINKMESCKMPSPMHCPHVSCFLYCMPCCNLRRLHL